MSRGLTLLEVLVVLAIVAVLLAVAWPYLTGHECVRRGEPGPTWYMQVGNALIPMEGDRPCLEWRKKADQ